MAKGLHLKTKGGINAFISLFLIPSKTTNDEKNNLLLSTDHRRSNFWTRSYAPVAQTEPGTCR